MPKIARNAITRGKARIEGLAELHENIAKVLDRAAGKEAKHIWMRAALVMRDEARDLAPELVHPHLKHVPGLLKKAIFAAYGDPSKPNVIVGVNRRIAPHAHWIEFGTTFRVTGDKKGKTTGNAVHSTGRIEAQPYMRPALTATRSMMVAMIAEGYRKLIDEAAS